MYLLISRTSRRYCREDEINSINTRKENSMDKDKHIGLRIDAETHRKFKYIVEFEGRSMNGELLYLIRQLIAEHEKKYGEIK